MSSVLQCFACGEPIDKADEVVVEVPGWSYEEYEAAFHAACLEPEEQD